MKDALGQTAQDLVQHPKMGHAVATATTSIGIGVVFEFLPAITGCVAAVSGIILTWVLICKARIETKKIELENKILEEKEKKLKHEDI